MRDDLTAALLCVVFAGPASAQGFAGLGADAGADFAMPNPERELTFPADHFAHPGYRIEWWYLTATLEGADGREYGAQWTLFRSALSPTMADGWETNQIWLGHAAVTTPDAHRFAERYARGGIGQAGISDPFAAFIDDWSMTSAADPEEDPLDVLSLTARGSDFAYALELTAEGPLVRHGEDGYSVKSPEGQASHYYSQPFYTVEGTLDLPSGEVEVTGKAWLDREWSSQPLAANQSGWDWFSLSFDSGAKLMGFGLRTDEQGTHFTSATWIEDDGTTETYGDGALALTPLRTASVEGRSIPVEWRLVLPDRGLDVTTQPLNPQAWMGTSFPYWEGPISIAGSHSGRGYLEMTGY
ncbi:iron ABC transporter permease [Roseivivax halodurans JCM 10272]|uniref:Iron ABC transporter permease n=1 Tax=Roseivivax halodurans JCM 10272 TaxID=1449350 RepID=X7EH32_9RHOB|nr:lipocalin-like domain-containing protein [Roseivivax halodurans]ETX14398.1 iron ABC transporter permease [Roseivivax halodurans JCM 10272]